MSVRLPCSNIPQDAGDDSSVQSSGDDDQEEETWEDWVSDSAENRPCRSLFDDTMLPSAQEALVYDATKHGFDLDQICSTISLDFHQRIRFINYIRKEKPASTHVIAVSGSESFLCDDKYLLPTLDDDPLLQTQSADWSDDEDEAKASEIPQNLSSAIRRISILEKNLTRTKQDLIEYRELVAKRLDIATLANVSSSSSSRPPSRDDDSHYFASYQGNDIHAIMLQDKVRTSTYASFILTNPALFRDAVVLDVGCGTGILSLFAARAGAKRVFAVDASEIVKKASEIVKNNSYGNVISVIPGKVEDITLPDGITQVDIIVSEWMGYALLYECMLDSVLHARDRFLRPGGIMAPSQCHMVLTLCGASDVHKERVEFWSDIYGFDLSVMADEVYEDAIIDIVQPETLLSNSCIIKDLYLRDISPQQLNFQSSFTLTSNVDRRTKVRAFVLHFDTFFAPSGESLPADTPVKIVEDGSPILAEVWPVGGRYQPTRRASQGGWPKAPEKEKITSFSTGPKSVPTHWKQTIFLLRDPISVQEGTVISGIFFCHKNPDNARELDVEIHYSVKEGAEDSMSGDVIVQMFKVR